MRILLRRSIAVVALALSLSAAASAAGFRDTSKGEGCAPGRPAESLALRGTIDALGSLHGWFKELTDGRSGTFVRRFTLAGLGETNGSDGMTAWIKDWSGTVHRYDAAHARAVAATDAWLERRGWCAADGFGARIASAASRWQAGHFFDVVRVVPRGGVPVEIWFDHANGLPDRTIVRLNEDTRVERFSDWREAAGTLVPFVRRIEYPEGGDVETLTTLDVRPRPSVRAGEFTPPPAPDDVRMAHGAGSTTVPIRIEAHKILVGVRLNGRGPFPFVLDTGGHFILTAATARRLGLPALGQRPGKSSFASSGFVRVRELRIGDAIVRDNVAHMIPYPFARVERGPLPPKAGWLGLELFERFSAIIDPGTRTLTLAPLRGRTGHYAGTRVRLSLDEDAPLAACRVDGFPGECMIDTGNAGPTIVEGHWARNVGLDRRFARGLEAGGGVRIARARVEVGAVHLGREIVAAYRPATRGSESTTVEAAILSETVHERYVTSIDYGRGAMWLAPIRNRTAAPFNRTGLQLRRRPDGSFDVAFVYAHSPAEAAGVRRGDRVLAIGGKPASALTPNDLVRMSTAPVGSVQTYRIVEARSGVPRTVRIRAAELLPP